MLHENKIKRVDKEEVTLSYLKRKIIETCKSSEDVNSSHISSLVREAKNKTELLKLAEEFEFFGDSFNDDFHKEIALFLKGSIGKRRAKKHGSICVCAICYRIVSNGQKRCPDHTPKNNEAEYKKAKRIRAKCKRDGNKTDPLLQLNDHNFKSWCKHFTPNVYQKIKYSKKLIDAIIKINGENKDLLKDLLGEYQKMAGIKEGEKIDIFYEHFERDWVRCIDVHIKGETIAAFGKAGYTHYSINKYNILTQRFFLNAEIWITAEKSRSHGGKRKGAGRPKK